MKNHNDDSLGYVANVCATQIELFLTYKKKIKKKKILLVKMAGVCLFSEYCTFNSSNFSLITLS